MCPWATTKIDAGPKEVWIKEMNFCWCKQRCGKSSQKAALIPFGPAPNKLSSLSPSWGSLCSQNFAPSRYVCCFFLFFSLLEPILVRGAPRLARLKVSTGGITCWMRRRHATAATMKQICIPVKTLRQIIADGVVSIYRRRLINVARSRPVNRWRHLGWI